MEEEKYSEHSGSFDEGIEDQHVRFSVLRGEKTDTRKKLAKPNPLVGKIVSKITVHEEIFEETIPTAYGTGSIVQFTHIEGRKEEQRLTLITCAHNLFRTPEDDDQFGVTKTIEYDENVFYCG